MDYLKGRVSLPPLPSEKRWHLPIFASSLVFAFLVLTALNMGLLASLSTLNAVFFSSSINSFSPPPALPPPLPSPPTLAIPRLAYLISGSKGDFHKLWRTLLAIYHPRNIYVVHLDLEAPAAERQNLSARVANHSLFSIIGNVHVITKANLISYTGSTMVANTLHACAILLKKSKNWDWFINLSASDYPLVTQDDLLFTFSKLPKNLNFMEHTSKLGPKENQRAKPVMIDPSLYKKSKSEIFFVQQKRAVPDAFKLFTGSAWMVLTREFVEFCIWGWDNFPRTVLMYYANFVSSPEGYFQTVLCNLKEFNTTVVNHDLHYISWNNPPQQHPRTLTLNDATKMISSNTPFARKFRENDPVLDMIDNELLGRPKNGVIPGGWCAGMPACSNVSNPEWLDPGPGSKRLALLINKLVLSDAFHRSQCR